MSILGCTAIGALDAWKWGECDEGSGALARRWTHIFFPNKKPRFFFLLFWLLGFYIWFTYYWNFGVKISLEDIDVFLGVLMWFPIGFNHWFMGRWSWPDGRWFACWVGVKLYAVEDEGPRRFTTPEIWCSEPVGYTFLLDGFDFGGSFGTHELPEEANGRREICRWLSSYCIILWFKFRTPSCDDVIHVSIWVCSPTQ